MVSRCRRTSGWTHERAKGHADDMASAAGDVWLLRLVEQDEDDTVGELGLTDERLEECREPGITVLHGAVVHAVAEVGYDEREVGESPA